MDKKNKSHAIIVLSVFLLMEHFCIAQQNFLEEEPDKVSIQPFLNFQLWGLNQHYQSETEDLNQMLMLFRRGRFGANAKVGKQWKMQVQFGFDGLGLVSTDSAKQSVNYQNALNIWSIQVQYKVFMHSEAMYLNVGYILPHLSRESVTSPWNVASLDKMRSSVALRYFVTGKTNGISPGITVGGLLIHKKLYYSAAIMPNAFYTAQQTQTQSPLLLGHVLFSLFGNEFDTYKYVLPTSGYEQNFGITLGLGGSYQGETVAFGSNTTIGCNALMVFHNFKVDAEYYALFRNNNGNEFNGYTYHIRASHTQAIRKANIQTSLAFWEYNCDKNLYNTSTNNENGLGAGVDYIPNKTPIKVGIHYTYCLAKNKFTYAPGIQNGKYVNAITVKLQATIK